MFNFITDYTLRTVVMGTVLLGIVSGIFGVFTLLKKQALIGDAISHATFPGVILAFIFSGQSSLPVLIIGAIIASILALALISLIKRYSKVKYDASLALILSSFFGFGQVLLSIIRDTAGHQQTRLNTFIFGQAATMSTQDIFLLMAVLAVVLIIIVFMWRHLKLYIFNQEYYQSLGFPGALINVFISTMTILVVVSGIQTVGVILMSALLIAPGVAARQWSDRLNINVILAALFGAIAAFIGTILSTNMATGPMIVIIASSIVLLSLLFAPKKGVIWREYKQWVYKKQVQTYKILIHLFEDNLPFDHHEFELVAMQEQGYVTKTQNQYQLTKKGKDKVLSILTGDI